MTQYNANATQNSLFFCNYATAVNLYLYSNLILHLHSIILYVVLLQSTTHSMLHTHTVCFIHRQSPNAQFVSAIMLGSLAGALTPNPPLSPIHFTSAWQICFEGHGSICICICAAAQCNHPLSPIHLIPARHLCFKEHRTSLNVTTIRKLTNCWPED